MGDELRILLTGYVDGELDAAERARVEQALAQDPELKRELEELTRLKEATAGGIDERTDADLEIFWSDVYNRIERRTAWILMLAGAAGVVAAGSYLFFTHTWWHWSVKLAAACGLLGTLLMLASVWRERQRALRHDRYVREVRR
jgi:ferric-dicitrate binding protein FerR (iron transport regulator)